MFGILILVLLSSSLAYIPAIAVNDTTSISNSSDIIQIVWQPSGVFRTSLSRQLYADPIDNTTSTYVQNNVARGVLVHFSEFNSTQPPAIVPWIALISCDSNGTVYSDVNDIFTLSRDQGAQAALLYSTTSQGCQINQDYLQNFQKPISVYSTTSLQGARLIESQFSNVGQNAYSFNSATLNSSQNAIETLLNSTTLVVNGNGLNTTIIVATLTNMPTSSSNTTLSNSTATLSSDSSDPTNVDDKLALSTSTGLPPATRTVMRRATSSGSAIKASSTPVAAIPSAAPISYLVAVLAPADSTVGAAPAPASTTSSTGNSSSSPTTSLAMIILYSITGIVSAMFLIVIFSGAIRALRHPERYGPRGGRFRNYSDSDAGSRDRPNQTIARGLTRAILDTFPIVKFGNNAEDAEDDRILRERRSEEGKEMELKEVENTGGSDSSSSRNDVESSRNDTESSKGVEVKETVNPASSTPSLASILPPPIDLPLAPLPILTLVPPSPIESATPIPTSSETCPICVSDFLEDEDIRILPCDRRHAFHPQCIDPWLLDISSACPLCRLDLNSAKDATSKVETEENLDEEAEREEEIVRENLRAMLSNSRGSGSNVSGSAAGVGAGNAGFSRNKFFKYVAAIRGAR